MQTPDHHCGIQAALGVRLIRKTILRRIQKMKKTQFSPATLALTALLLTIGNTALADESTSEGSFMNGNARSTGYFGALIGANIPSGNAGSDNSTNFGLTLGAKVAPYLGLGFYGTYYGQSDSGRVFGLQVGTSSSTFNLAGEINGFFSIFHVGVDVGAQVVSWSANAGNASIGRSNTAMIYGPEAGFDIPLGSAVSHLSLGGEVHYLLTTESQGQNNLQALAAIKFWM
jgi:hypothetical protein